MFKTGRWRSEKNKIKALFRLNFHATGVAQVAGDSLVISLIPADVGKPTVRSEKAVLKEGNCYWEKPILESLRFFREPRTGKFQEKIYYFVVSNGWSKADFVGEVSIDFATYAECFKVSSVSLPLKNTNCDALLHVSIQRVQEDVDQREIEEIESATTTPSNDRSLRAQINNKDADDRIKGEYTCAPSSPLYDEVPVTPEIRRTNRGSCGSDLTMSSSEGSYGIENPTEFGSKDNIIQRDPTSVLPTIVTSQSGTATSAASGDVAATDEVIPKPEPLTSSLPTTKVVLLTCACLESAQSGADISALPNEVEAADQVVPKNEPVACSLPKTGGTRLDTSLSGTVRFAIPNDMAAPDCKVSKPQLVASGSPKIVHEQHSTAQAELLLNCGPEASTFNSSDSPPRDVFPVEKSEESSSLLINQLRAEISTLRRKAEVAELELHTLRKSIVKESRKGQDLLKEVVSLKDEKKFLRIECEKAKAKNKFEKGDPRALIEELRQELNYEKERNANLRVQLVKMQEANSELMLAIQELDELLEQKDNELLNLSNSFKSETDDKEEQKIADLCNELETHKRDKEELEGHIEQLVLDYEILKQENHDLLHQLEQNEAQEQLKLQYECSFSYATISGLEAHVEKLENELKEQSSKFSESLTAISELEEHSKSLLEDLEKQAQGFEDDIDILTRDKIELEKRAITAEEALRKMRWQNANTADKIHEEFRRLSVEMTSTLDSNEKFTKKTLFEVNELRMQKSNLEDLLKKSKEELHLLTEHYEANLNELSCQLSSKVNCIQQLEKEKTCWEESNATLSNEMLMLRAEIEMLTTENKSLSAEAEETQSLKSEFDQMNVSMREMELVLEKGNAENLEKEIENFHLREEVQQLVKELNSLREVKDEKEIMIHFLTEQYEAVLNELSCQLSSKVNCIEQLENEKTHGEENNATLSNEILMLRAEIETLKKENNSLFAEVEEKQSLKSEYDQMNVSMREMELVLEKGKVENLEREREIIHLQEEVRQLVSELNSLREEKDEKETMIHLLTERYEADLNKLSCQLSSKVNCIEQLENEKACGEESKMTLSKDILLLRAEIETLKTENNSLSVEVEEKQSLKSEFDLMNVSMREMELVLEKGKSENMEREREIIHLCEEVQQLVNELNSTREEKDEKEIMIENLQSDLKTLQNQHDELKHLLSEDELEKDNLKNKIKSLEGQIKMKEDDLQTLTNSYLKKEKDLQKGMEELEKRLEDSCTQKVDQNNDAICLDGNTCKIPNIITKQLKTEPYLFSGLGKSSFSPKNTIESCGVSPPDQEDIDESSKEIVLLKERNKEMEHELKEMQERYSEMSLKLAEVEGSRQQLMMRVRNLKNAKKS